MCEARHVQNTQNKKVCIIFEISQGKRDRLSWFFARRLMSKFFYKVILWSWWGCSRIPKVPKRVCFAMSLLQNIKKEVRDKIEFLHVDKHQSFLLVGFNTLGVNISYQVKPSLLIGMIKHSQILKVTLQYLEKEVRDAVCLFACR